MRCSHSPSTSNDKKGGNFWVCPADYVAEHLESGRIFVMKYSPDCTAKHRKAKKKTYLQRPVASYQHRRRSNSPMDPTLAVKAVQCPQQLCGAAADGGQREGPLGAGHRPAISNLKRGNSARAQRRSRLPCWKTTGTENAGDLDEMPKSAPHPPPRGVQHISPPAFISPPPRLPFVQKILRSGGKQTLTFWGCPR